MTTRVIGIDVSKASVSCCILEQLPPDPKEYFWECPFWSFPANADGLRKLLALSPTIAVMEPTGVNYSILWGTHLARAGVPVWLVGHKELRSYRTDHLRMPGKDDDTDALALACYWWQYHQTPRRFVQERTPEMARMRELVLRLAHLSRVASPIVNRLRQDLAWQFPEVALCHTNRRPDGTYPLWSFIAGEENPPRLAKKLALTVGSGLQPPAIAAARRLNDLGKEEAGHERELATLLARPEYAPYRRVFARFGFGFRVQCFVLSQIFPLSNFLDEDGRAIVKVSRGRISKKPTKKRLSLRRFKKMLGLTTEKEESGDSKHKVRRISGSDLCRKAFWQWVFTRIEPVKCRPRNEIGQRLGALLDELKASGTPIRLARMKVAVKGGERLFQELVKAMGNPETAEEE